jgi:hypothetical protein
MVKTTGRAGETARGAATEAKFFHQTGAERIKSLDLGAARFAE